MLCDISYIAAVPVTGRKKRNHSPTETFHLDFKGRELSERLHRRLEDSVSYNALGGFRSKSIASNVKRPWRETCITEGLTHRVRARQRTGCINTTNTSEK